MCVCVHARMCVHVLVCDYKSMNRRNSSKEFIFIDEGVLPSGDYNNSHIAESPLTR